MSQRRQSESGVAAIEFAMVLPVLLLLFFGLVNITQYVSAVRKVRVAAELMTDLVTLPDPVVQSKQKQPSAPKEDAIYASSVDDYFKAVELSLRPLSASWVQANVGIDVYDYQMGSAGLIRWSKFYGGTRRCTQPSTTNTAITLSIVNSDVVVVVVCMDYSAPAATIPGFEYLAKKRIESTFYSRPRQYDTLTLDTSG